jgi:hypothetical protein
MTSLLALLLTLTLFMTLAGGQELSFEVMEEQGPGLLGNIAVKANLTTVLGQAELQSLQYTVVEDNIGGPSGTGDGSIFYVDQTSGDLSTKVRTPSSSIITHYTGVGCVVYGLYDEMVHSLNTLFTPSSCPRR